MKQWILITKDPHETAELMPSLPDGFELVAFPVFRPHTFADPEAWGRVRANLASIGILAFTSRHAASFFLNQAQTHGLVPWVFQLPAAAVGPTTAKACSQAGFQVRVVGQEGGALLADTIAQSFPKPRGVLFPCGRDYREELIHGLEGRGFAVFPVRVYAMEPTPPEALPQLPQSQPQAVVLTSPRAAALYWQLTGGRFSSVPHLAWGPTTAAHIKTLGLDPVVLPQPTAEGLKEVLWQIS